MLTILEHLLLALTDSQFDKVLVLVTEILLAFKTAVLSLWALASPLLIGYVALQLARYQQAAKEARATIVGKIEEKSKKAQEDRSKIIDDLGTNTKISETAFETANGHNAKMAALLAEIVELKKELAEAKASKIPPIPS